jgi:sulfoxide reductase heme-binding subunit YedZ
MTAWTTFGIVGGWMMIILGLSFYVRGRVGQQRWRKLHRFTALAWILGLAHSLGEGTDAGQLWFLVATAIVVLPAAALLVVRLSPRRPAPRAVAGARP